MNNLQMAVLASAILHTNRSINNTNEITETAEKLWKWMNAKDTEYVVSGGCGGENTKEEGK